MLTEDQKRNLSGIREEVRRVAQQCRQRVLRNEEAKALHESLWNKAMSSIEHDSTEWRVLDRTKLEKASWWVISTPSPYVDRSNCEKFETLEDALNGLLDLPAASSRQAQKPQRAADETAAERRDVFLCHAGEDRTTVVQPLVDALDGHGISYWYAQAEIKWGDSLIAKVNEGQDIRIRARCT